ncbi:Hypothetical protein A7982_07412 [Minicystis rosea]|nr:Hypothetical protein A7982_07412 [Minicystis rosea]
MWRRARLACGGAALQMGIDARSIAARCAIMRGRVGSFEAEASRASDAIVIARARTSLGCREEMARVVIDDERMVEGVSGGAAAERFA